MALDLNNRNDQDYMSANFYIHFVDNGFLICQKRFFKKAKKSAQYVIIACFVYHVHIANLVWEK